MCNDKCKRKQANEAASQLPTMSEIAWRPRRAIDKADRGLLFITAQNHHTQFKQVLKSRSLIPSESSSHKQGGPSQTTEMQFGKHTVPHCVPAKRNYRCSQFLWLHRGLHFSSTRQTDHCCLSSLFILSLLCTDGPSC